MRPLADAREPHYRLRAVAVASGEVYEVAPRVAEYGSRHHRAPAAPTPQAVTLAGQSDRPVNYVLTWE